MSIEYHSIPTQYKDVWYDSIIEATWAAYMDLLGWDVSRTGLILSGYIPDFWVRRMAVDLDPPLLVEVKWCLLHRELEQFRRKIETRYNGPYVIVGGRYDIQIGRGVDLPIIPDNARKVWAEAVNLTRWRPKPKPVVPISKPSPTPVVYQPVSETATQRLSSFMPVAVEYTPPKP